HAYSCYATSSSLLPLSSLFSCYAHHLDHHSFPTRRSSDLQAAHLGLGDPHLGGDLHLGFPLVEPQGEDVALPLPQPVQSILQGEDRKSTRLNSSHVSISYAVFCLKKKKQKQ